MYTAYMLRKTPFQFLAHPHPHDLSKPILKTDQLSVQYASGPALDGISFEVHRGERLAVIGPNGAGKSTLFKVIAGVLTPSSGKVEVAGHEPSGHICIAYVPQRSQVDWNFPVTVADVVMMGRTGKIGLFRTPKRADQQLVYHALETVRLEEYAKRQISQLSGGQQQRMFIARALAQEAELMLMDEPLTGLDAGSQEDIFTILDSLRGLGVTAMVALHDIKLASERFDRLMLLNKRLVGIGTAAEVLTNANLVDAYGGRLRLVETPAGTLPLGDTCCEDGDHAHA